MSDKPMVIVSGIAVAALVLGVVVWLASRGRPAEEPRVAVVERSAEDKRGSVSECAEIVDHQKRVSVSLEKKPVGSAKEYEFIVELETQYPANAATIALSYHPGEWKVLRIDAGASAFPIEAPGEERPGFMKMTRGISGKGAGLVGRGEFLRVVFQRVGKDVNAPDPQIEGEQSEVFLNNGCAAKALLHIRNQES